MHAHRQSIISFTIIAAAKMGHHTSLCATFMKRCLPLVDTYWHAVSFCSYRGKYTVYMWDCGRKRWTTVTIDDSIPVKAGTLEPYFSNPRVRV